MPKATLHIEGKMHDKRYIRRSEQFGRGLDLWWCIMRINSDQREPVTGPKFGPIVFFPNSH